MFSDYRPCSDMLGKDPIAAYCAGAILSDRKIQKKAARAIIKKQIELQKRGRRKFWRTAPEQEHLRLVRLETVLQRGLISYRD